MKKHTLSSFKENAKDRNCGEYKEFFKFFLIGKTFKFTQNMFDKLNINYRVISIDDKHLIVTRDYKSDRYNLNVVNDKIKEITFG